MTASSYEQRNAYKGKPQRPWVRIRIADKNGINREFDLLADTGNPCAIIISALALMQHAGGRFVRSNFGGLQGGWLQLAMPELGLDQGILGFGSDAVVAAAQASSPDFEGLVGLPLLRLMEYGGDANGFWVRPLSGQP
jgi:hypothetical protein